MDSGETFPCGFTSFRVYSTGKMKKIVDTFLFSMFLSHWLHLTAMKVCSVFALTAVVLSFCSGIDIQMFKY